jgi:hypothetical protein
MELPQLLQCLFRAMIPMLWRGISLILLMTRRSIQRTSRVNGFVGISI